MPNYKRLRTCQKKWIENRVQELGSWDAVKQRYKPNPWTGKLDNVDHYALSVARKLWGKENE